MKFLWIAFLAQSQDKQLISIRHEYQCAEHASKDERQQRRVARGHCLRQHWPGRSHSERRKMVQKESHEIIGQFTELLQYNWQGSCLNEVGNLSDLLNQESK
jgi:hypothetical protein